MPPAATLTEAPTQATPKTPPAPKPKALTFARLKPHLKNLPPEALIALIERLHGLDTSNKFLLAGTFEPTAPIHSKEMVTLKTRLQRLLCPKAYNRDARLSEAVALIKEYKKTNDSLGLCDLYLTFIETAVAMVAKADYRGYDLLGECEAMVGFLTEGLLEDKVAATRLFKARVFELRRLALKHADDTVYFLLEYYHLFKAMGWQTEAEAEAPWPALKTYTNVYYKGRPLVVTAASLVKDDDDEA
jgi:hypothetical protein